MKSSLPVAILLSGLIVGTVDMLSACISAYLQSGATPEIVCRYIASGVWGKDAFTGGNGMIVMGLLFHYMIAYSFTIIFFLLYPKIKWMQEYKIATAILYGIFMWATTTQILLPLSNVKTGPLVLWKALIAVGILIIAIGIPLWFLAGNYYKNKQPASK